MDANATDNRKNDYTELGAAASPKLMYHIRKEAEAWQLRFVSGDGLAVLGCTREDFLQRLSDCRSYNADTESYVRVGDVFNMLAERPQERNYVGPLCGDTLYGSESPYIRRHALHAAVTSFPHPDGRRMTVRAPLPDDITELIRALFADCADSIFEEINALC